MRCLVPTLLWSAALWAFLPADPPLATVDGRASDRPRHGFDGNGGFAGSAPRLELGSGRLGCAFVSPGEKTSPALSSCAARALPSLRPTSASAGRLSELGVSSKNEVSAAFREVFGLVWDDFRQFATIFV